MIQVTKKNVDIAIAIVTAIGDATPDNMFATYEMMMKVSRYLAEFRKKMEGVK